MSKRKIISIENGAYFYTARIYNGLTIFADNEFAVTILDSLRWLRENKRMYLFAFVVMPNRVHFIFRPRNEYSVEKVCHAFGSFTTHKILILSRNKGRENILATFSMGGLDQDDRNNVIWNDTLVITIDNQYHLHEKMEYVHNNPMNKNWKLCAERADYLYSSAVYYNYGRKPVIEIDDISIFNWI